MGVTSTQDGAPRRQLPWLERLHLPESLEMFGSMSWGLACLDLLWQLRKAGKVLECWQM